MSHLASRPGALAPLSAAQGTAVHPLWVLLSSRAAPASRGAVLAPASVRALGSLVRFALPYAATLVAFVTLQPGELPRAGSERGARLEAVASVRSAWLPARRESPHRSPERREHLEARAPVQEHPASLARAESERPTNGKAARSLDLGPPGAPPPEPDAPVVGFDALRKHPDGAPRRLERLQAAQLTHRELKPAVVPGAVTVVGPLPSALIRRYIARQKGALLACYRRAVQKDPKVEGKALLSFTIAPNGKVVRPAVRDSTLKNRELEACLAERLARLRFPLPENAGVVKVAYPFLFQTRDQTR